MQLAIGEHAGACACSVTSGLSTIASEHLQERMHVAWYNHNYFSFGWCVIDVPMMILHLCALSIVHHLEVFT